MVGEIESMIVCARAPRVHRVSASASYRSLLTCRPPCSLLLPPLPCQLFAIVPIGGQRGNVLELAPWTWKGGRNVDPGVYNNVFDDLDTSPVWRTLCRAHTILSFVSCATAHVCTSLCRSRITSPSPWTLRSTRTSTSARLSASTRAAADRRLAPAMHPACAGSAGSWQETGACARAGY